MIEEIPYDKIRCFQYIKISIYKFVVMYNEDTFTCYKASVDKISDLKEIINSTIFKLSQDVQNYQIFAVIQSRCKSKDDGIINDKFQTKKDNNEKVLMRKVQVI